LIMAEGPVRDFGKRRPVTLPPAPPVKRSGHVGLLVMGALAVGGGAYALMPRENCGPSPPGMAAPALPQTNAGCGPRGSSSFGGGYGRSSSFGFFGGDSGHSSSATTADSSGVTRGGFGSFAQAFGFSGRG
jgi:hypothetical protein